MKPTNGKTWVRFIILERAEGPADQCQKPQILKSFEESDKILWRWARTAPGPKGGYDKCDFFLIFYDGESYQGRFDLKKGHAGYPNLIKNHVEELQKINSGLHRPSWMTPENYAEMLEQDEQYSPGSQERAMAFLDEYELTTWADHSEEERERAEREDRKRLCASVEA